MLLAGDFDDILDNCEALDMSPARKRVPMTSVFEKTDWKNAKETFSSFSSKQGLSGHVLSSRRKFDCIFDHHFDKVDKFYLCRHCWSREFPSPMPPLRIETKPVSYHHYNFRKFQTDFITLGARAFDKAIKYIRFLYRFDHKTLSRNSTSFDSFLKKRVRDTPPESYLQISLKLGQGISLNHRRESTSLHSYAISPVKRGISPVNNENVTKIVSPHSDKPQVVDFLADPDHQIPVSETSLQSKEKTTRIAEKSFQRILPSKQEEYDDMAQCTLMESHTLHPDPCLFKEENIKEIPDGHQCCCEIL
ncbi:hypothetical protein ADUPG1_001392 [Aduncisulcus paluster]|uniref:Uncharacterized protein n=1 Tax=Aduncisulcus paluster TaxID=2918883 RepID=A0ABQ5KFG1_9EUKA|nr:hypothetical protein ADUPG1_001392 [Aduncisulcus paluster]